MNDTVQVLGVQLSYGISYRVVCADSSIDYHGHFDGWDPASDMLHFVNSDGTYGNLLIPAEHVTCVVPLGDAIVDEADPNGIDAHSAGAKLDSGKIYADAVLSEMPRAIWGIAEVGTFGANKYSLGGWVSVEDGIRRYRDAAARHRLKRQMGETIDPDSGLKHTFHEAWNVLASLELEERSK